MKKEKQIKKERHKVRPPKVTNRSSQVIGKENVTNYMIIRMGYIKIRIYSIKSKDYQDKYRKNIKGTEMK